MDCEYIAKPHDVIGDEFICGKVFIVKEGNRPGSIVFSQKHDHSYEVFYDSISIAESKKIEKSDLLKGLEVCFQIIEIRGIPFAKNLHSKDKSDGLKLTNNKIKTGIYFHDRKNHDFSKQAHVKTHIIIPPEGRYQNIKLVYAFKDGSNTFNAATNPNDYKLILLTDDQKDYLDIYANKVFYADWSTPREIENLEVIELSDFNKCHNHDNLEEVCIPN